MEPPLLSVKGLSCSRSKEQTLFNGLSFNLNDGDILVLSGRSGTGKTTLLKCLSHLNVYQGDVLLHGKKAIHYGVPVYRTRVLYVPQRPSLLPSTPRDFLNLVMTYKSRKPSGDQSKSDPYSTSTAKPGTINGPVRYAEQWGIDEELWDRPWSSLSGGESQRIALAVAVGTPGAEVLLLDEPTSALDAETTSLVEASLLKLIEDDASTVKALVWITHSPEQGRRVGTRYLYLDEGHYLETMEMGMPSSRSVSRAPSRAPSTVAPNSSVM